MFSNRIIGVWLLAFCAMWLLLFTATSARAFQIAQPMEKMEHAQHAQHEHHHLHLPMGEEKCEPAFTYQEGPQGPRHWSGLCGTGKMQSPIDIQQSEKFEIDDLKFKYQPAALDIVNDCNEYRVLVKFPDNYWLTVGKKPYFLTELHFRQPGENAVHGKRPRMSVQFVHFSPEGVFLVIEVPIVAGKENPVIKTLWEHIPAPGKEAKPEGVKINPADLLPADPSFYRYPGSLTTPICNEVAQWYVMKNPIELSEAQIAAYTKHYNNTARPLQPLNDRPVDERP
ncbi:MAG TPA: carbonic anhydrase family protein [Terriglobia bacterium]|nr:carbonic anhydrase family protein [Terriglobia bacterium]